MGLGTVVCRSMLAQVFCVPEGMTVDLGASGCLAAAAGAGSEEAGAGASQDVAAAAWAQPPSSLFLGVSQAFDSSVGTESG